MNSTQKSELSNVLTDGIHIPSAIPEPNMKMYVLTATPDNNQSRQ